jgi:Ca2+-binding EF-hand superfamily protein
MISNINISNNIQQSVAEIYKQMRAADTDGIKGLSKDELSSVDTSKSSEGASFIQTLSDEFDNLDIDENGQLSGSEMSFGKPPKIKLQAGVNVNDASFLNNLADINNSDGLSINELSSFSSSNARVNDLINNFEDYDTNNNGELSKSELEVAFLNSPSKPENNIANKLGDFIGEVTSSFAQKLINNYQSGNLSNLSNLASSFSLNA